MGERKPRPHERLELWKEALGLAATVYRVTQKFPADEKFGLTSQMRRSAVSVPSNVAEGCARNSNAEKGRFLSIARGSLSELETQLMLSRELGFASAPSVEEILERCGHVDRLLNGLQARIRN